MELVTPEIGLIFWTTIVFLLLLIVLKKYAWKPILAAVDERNKSIEDALKIIKVRASQMESSGYKNPGKMLALINATKEQIEEICNISE